MVCVVSAPEQSVLDDDCEAPLQFHRVGLRLRGVEQPVTAIDAGALVVAAAPVVHTELALLDETVKNLKGKLWHVQREKSAALQEAEVQVRAIKDTLKAGARHVAHAVSRATNGLEYANKEIKKIRKDAKYYYSLAYKQGLEIEELRLVVAKLKAAWKSEESERLTLEGKTRRLEIAVEKESRPRRSKPRWTTTRSEPRKTATSKEKGKLP